MSMMFASDATHCPAADTGLPGLRVAGTVSWNGYWCYWFSAGVPAMRST